MGALIGEGAYGKVYECLNVDTGEILVSKHVKVSGDPEKIKDEVMSLSSEIQLLKQLSHRNIVHYVHTEINSDLSAVDIIMEYVPGGSIRSLLNRFGRFTENMVKRYTHQILEGLAYLHENGIIHRDIKGANLLVDNDGTIKLTDFGASKRLETAHVNE
jgi:serine/threonine protein kinase